VNRPIKGEIEMNNQTIDQYVRLAAKGGDFDGTANYWRNVPYKGGSLVIRATFGAGSNSASVHFSRNKDPRSVIGATELYNAACYGHHFEFFRKGPWLNVVQQLAKEQSELEILRKRMLKIQKEELEMSRFKDTDI
jgi:hypothetical protein